MTLIFLIIILLTVLFIIKRTSTTKDVDLNKDTVVEEENIFLNVEDTSLSNVMNNISRGDKLILLNVSEKWSVTKDTISHELNSKVMNIINNILKSISEITGNLYYSKTIENMYVMKDMSNNYRCILNSFIYDVNNYFTIKLILDIVSVDEEVYINFIDLDVSSNDNILNNYDLKYDGHGILSNYDMFDENVGEILDDYYSRYFEIIKLDYKNKHIIDTSATCTLNQLKNYYFPSKVPIRKSSPQFCNKYTNDWNANPINIDKNCIMHNNTYEQYPNIPNNIPGAIVSNPDENKYTWLFNSDRGVINSNN